MSFFLAADLDEPVRAEVGARIDALRDRVNAKWLRFDKLHITLRFLGHPSAEQLQGIRNLAPALAMNEVGSFR